MPATRLVELLWVGCGAQHQVPTLQELPRLPEQMRLAPQVSPHTGNACAAHHNGHRASLLTVVWSRIKVRLSSVHQLTW